MGRRTRSFLPAKSSLYTPNIISGKSVKKKLQCKQQKQKHYYDRNAKEKTPLSTGDSVRIRSHQSSWNPGEVVKQCKEPISYIVKSGDRTFIRNRKDLMKTKERSVPENSHPWEEVTVLHASGGLYRYTFQKKNCRCNSMHRPALYWLCNSFSFDQRGTSTQTLSTGEYMHCCYKRSFVGACCEYR
jgi:hypothetical protein